MYSAKISSTIVYVFYLMLYFKDNFKQQKQVFIKADFKIWNKPVVALGGGELESTPLKSSDNEASSSLELKSTLDFFCCNDKL